MINKKIIGFILLIVLFSLVFPTTAFAISNFDRQNAYIMIPMMYPDENTPPLPPIISGPTTGKTNVHYDYNFFMIEYDEGDFITILEVDFGNDVKQAMKKNCAKPWYNGTDIWMSHQWNQKGEYAIKARVMDSYGAWSNWSEPYPMSIPKQKSYTSQWPSFTEFIPILFSFFTTLKEI